VAIDTLIFLSHDARLVTLERVMAKIVERTWTGADGTERRGWQCDFIDQHGKRQRKQFQRRKDADAFMITARSQVQVGTFTSDASTITFGAACELWLQRATAEGLERSTLALYGLQARQLCDVIDGSTKLSRVTKPTCEHARDRLLERHKRPTARKLVAALRMILGDAKRRGLVAVNVAADTKVATAKRHKAKLRAGVDFPLPGELSALLKAADPKAKALVALAALAGLRASELRALPWTDVHLNNHPTVTISQRADAWCAIGPPKAEASRRSIPLSSIAVQALREWRLAQPPGRALLFGTGTDRPDMRNNLQRRLLTPLCALAGVPRYTWHGLRHYAISSWLAAHIDLKTVQHWAGHATLAMTLDTYGHLIPRDDDHQRIAAAERALHVT
jgi:integrase